MSIILFIVILIILVLVHELGHFIVAKKSGIKVDEFGFGFPPRLWSFKKGETVYSLNLIPFGGFVKIFGEDPKDPNDPKKEGEEEITEEEKKRSFANKPKYIKAGVLVAGVFFNFILAYLLLSFGLFQGLPSSFVGGQENYTQNKSLIITSVLEKSPALEAGLKAGDKIVGVADALGLKVQELTPVKVKDFISAHRNQSISFEIERNKEQKSIEIIPVDGVIEGVGAVGISMDLIGVVKLPFFKAFTQGFILTLNLTKDVAVSLFSFIGSAIVGKAGLDSITGPVGMVNIVGDAYHMGLAYLLSFMALISINLAVINLIPFPSLDGGRLLFLLIEKIKGSEIKPKIANIFNVVGFVVLILLMIVVTFNDVIKLF